MRTETSIDRLQTIFTKVCEDLEAELVECDGEDDHVHLLINYPPKVSMSRLVNSLKGVASRRLRQYDSTIEHHCRKSVLWSPTYYAGSCGAALEIVKPYVASQRNEH